eukprot:7391875-Prymnesium_polylepis.3
MATSRSSNAFMASSSTPSSATAISGFVCKLCTRSRACRSFSSKRAPQWSSTTGPANTALAKLAASACGSGMWCAAGKTATRLRLASGT